MYDFLIPIVERRLEQRDVEAVGSKSEKPVSMEFCARIMYLIDTRETVFNGLSILHPEKSAGVQID